MKARESWIVRVPGEFDYLHDSLAEALTAIRCAAAAGHDYTATLIRRREEIIGTMEPGNALLIPAVSALTSEDEPHNCEY